MAPKPSWSIRKNRTSTEEFYVLQEGVADGKSSMFYRKA